ncbi:hypothetical protein J3F83DRAFT_717573 [Trichoderma novae-zelandiae]
MPHTPASLLGGVATRVSCMVQLKAKGKDGLSILEAAIQINKRYTVGLLLTIGNVYVTPKAVEFRNSTIYHLQMTLESQSTSRGGHGGERQTVSASDSDEDGYAWEQSLLFMGGYKKGRDAKPAAARAPNDKEELFFEACPKPESANMVIVEQLRRDFDSIRNDLDAALWPIPPSLSAVTGHWQSTR